MKRYLRVFAKILDPKTNWYAFNDSLHGYQPNRNQQTEVAFKKLAGDVRRLTQDVYGSDGNLAPFNWFDSCTRVDEEVTLLQSRRL